MKKGVRRLLIFELLLLLILVINSFIYNILIGLIMSLFMAFVLLIFKLIFGFEKSKYRVTKNIILDTIIYVLVFLIIYYLFGIIIGFAKVGNYFTLAGIRDYIAPIITLVIIREVLRYNLLKKSENSKMLIYLSVVVFIMLDITNSIYYGIFNDTMHIFKFIALIVLPSISYNIYATYVNIKAGYLPVIIYSLVIYLYAYIIPIIPNANEYLTSIVNFLLPIVLTLKVYSTVKNENDEYLSRNYNKKGYLGIIVSAIIVMVLVYFSSGYFSYSAVAIATGSMSPAIDRGDIVIVHKTEDYDNINVGDVIVYNYHNVIVVHRLANKIKIDNEYYFYSKGDANKEVDNYIIEQDMIVGLVKYRIPYLGMPTVWLNELWEE